MILQARNITFGYSEREILSDISFDIKQGEILSLLGPNGSGKTSLLKCINYILRPQKGVTMVFGENVAKMKPKKRAQCIAYVPQDNPRGFHISVIDTIMMGRLPFTEYRIREKDKAIVFEMIEMMELEAFAFKSINEMSGGERQRVFIARALAQEPKVLLLDEPTSSLDMKNQLFTLQLIQRLAQEKELAVIMSIHDLNLASMGSDRILMLEDAAVFAYGRSEEVINEENIYRVYGVKTAVSIEDNHVHVRLLKHKNA
jgi:iron complex transport system ATP-binding protein